MADDRSSTVPVRMKVGYGVGDFAFNLAYQTVALFLLYYFTDVFGIDAAIAGSIFLVSKLWDAVSDPIMGVITDHTRSRWGKKRPYLLFGALPFGVSIFLLFAGPSIAPSLRPLYGYATFIFFSTAITILNIPYGALTSVMSKSSVERASISGYRTTFALVGTLVAAGATKPIVLLFPNELMGHRVVGAIYGVVAIIIAVVAFLSVRERVPDTTRVKETLKGYVRVVFSNLPFLVLAGSSILFLTAVNMLAAIVNYYFKYNLGAESQATLAFLALFVTAIILIPLFVYLSKRKGKKFAYILGMVVFVIALLALYAMGSQSLLVTIIIFVVGGIGLSAVYLCPWAMIPDTVEYSEWKTGLRREGILYGAFFFCFKLGAAFAGFITGTVLQAAGYVANAAQTPRALHAIQILLTIVPAGLMVLGIALLGLYPISLELHKRILAEIEARHSGGEQGLTQS